MSPSASLNNDLQQMLPLSPAAFFVLFALADGEKHGYLIMQEIKVLSDGKLQIGPATLYTTIQKLADQSFIEEVENDSQGPSSKLPSHAGGQATTQRGVLAAKRSSSFSQGKKGVSDGR